MEPKTESFVIPFAVEALMHPDVCQTTGKDRLLTCQSSAGLQHLNFAA